MVKRYEALAALCVFAAGAARAETYVNWAASVTDGYYDAATNWVGGVAPSNGVIGAIKMSTNYVIRFPAGGLVENGATRVSDVSNGKSIVFDTLGTWWLKSGPDAWPSNWKAFMIAWNGDNHLFNIESLRESAANDYPVMLMSNAVFRYTYATSGATVALE